MPVHSERVSYMVEGQQLQNSKGIIMSSIKKSDISMCDDAIMGEIECPFCNYVLKVSVYEYHAGQTRCTECGEHIWILWDE